MAKDGLLAPAGCVCVCVCSATVAAVIVFEHVIMFSEAAAAFSLPNVGFDGEPFNL